LADVFDQFVMKAVARIVEMFNKVLRVTVAPDAPNLDTTSETS
jgi:hypothetical protein